VRETKEGKGETRVAQITPQIVYLIGNQRAKEMPAGTEIPSKDWEIIFGEKKYRIRKITRDFDNNKITIQLAF